MRIAQRGTSFTNIGGNSSTPTIFYRTADRWGLLSQQSFNPALADWGHAGRFNESVESDAPNGFSKSLKMTTSETVTTFPAPTEAFVAVTQRIEGQNLSVLAKGTPSAKPAVISFWVKSNRTGTYVCELLDVDNSRSVSLQYTISSSAVWEQKIIQIPFDTTGAFVYDNTSGLEVVFYVGAGPNLKSGTLQTSWGPTVTANRAVGQTNVAATAGGYWQITGIQLEQNYQPTPFEQRPIGTELALCQRYYWRLSAENTGSTQRIGAPGKTYGLNTFVGTIRLPVKMRARPTSLESNGLFATDDQYFDSTSGTWTVAATYCTTESLLIYGSTLSGVTVNGYAQIGMANNTGYFGVSAEL